MHEMKVLKRNMTSKTFKRAAILLLLAGSFYSCSGKTEPIDDICLAPDPDPPLSEICNFAQNIRQFEIEN